MKLLTKIILPVIVISIISTSILIYISTKTQEKIITNMLNKQIESNINTVTYASDAFNTVINFIGTQYKIPEDGVVMDYVNAVGLEKLVDKASVGNKGFAFTVDPSGTILIHNDKKLIGTNIIDLESWGKKILLKDKDIMIENYKGEKYNIIFKKIDNNNKLVVFYSISEFQKEINVLKYAQIIIISLAILLIIFILIYIVQLRIIKPLNRLIESMKKVGKGQLNTRIKLSNSKDEIGILGEDFNSMVSEMRNMAIKVKDTTRIIRNSSTMISQSTNEANESSKQIKIAVHEIVLGVEHLAEETNKTFKATSELANNIDSVINISNNKQNNHTSNQTNSINNFYGNDYKINLNEQIDFITNKLKYISEKKDIALESVKNISTITEQSSSATEEIYATIEEQSISIEKISLAIAELHYLVILLSDLTDRFEY